MFQLCFFWNMVITALYWGFVLPNGGSGEFTSSEYEKILFDLEHTIPFLLTFIDWCLNSIGAQWSQIWLNTGLSVLYGLVNFLYVKITGETIYPVLTWDGLTAYLVALALIPGFILVQILLIVCTNYKLRKVNQDMWRS